MRVLIADNDTAHRAQLSQWLTNRGATVVEAISIEEVLKLCKKRCPGLILIDDNLSGAKGSEIVSQIRALGGHALWNPVVIMGGSDLNSAEAGAGIDSGADDYELKPLSENKLAYKLSMAKRIEEMKDDVFAVAHDLVMANRAMEIAFTQDSLTGILDVSSFHQALQKEWDDATKNKKTLALALINIDNFREFNDVYGSQKGDEVIKLVASALNQCLPKQYDIVARTIGDTFAVLLPDTNSGDASSIANTLHDAVASLKVEHSQSRVSKYLSVSIGVANTEEQGLSSGTDLMEAADFALYQAKHKGRNRVFSTCPVSV